MPLFGISFEGYMELEAEDAEEAERVALFYMEGNDCDITSVELIDEEDRKVGDSKEVQE